MPHLHFDDTGSLADNKLPKVSVASTSNSAGSANTLKPITNGIANASSPSSPSAKRKREDVNGTPPSQKPKSKKKFKPNSGSRSSSNIKSAVNPSIQQRRRELPIWAGRDAIVDAIRENDTVVILGETGSGKTTQVPQFLHEAGYTNKGVIGITQTRRVAATSLAARVSEEQGTGLGNLVGYSVRFDDLTSHATRIKFLTDGMLVRDLLSDPLLKTYSVIIVDEAHERTLRTDLLISRLKDIQKQRNHPTRENGHVNGTNGTTNGTIQQPQPLKVIVMSATLDAEKFSQFYNNAKILYVQGRQHPVKIFYTSEPQLDYLDTTLRTFFQIHITNEDGDILVFLPGQEDIENLSRSISEYTKLLPSQSKGVTICPLYSALPPSLQGQVFSKAAVGTRKCILATNIAETAITIPGVKFVIDTGTFKEKNYSTKLRNGIDALITKPISKASAMQRAGRAGREGPGSCYRLFTEQAFKELPDSSVPEIQRSNLASSMLHLKYLGQDPESIEWMDSPNPDAFTAALVSLWGVQAIDTNRHLTEIGKLMAVFPLEPAYARAVIASKELQCTSEVLDIIAVLSATSSIFHDLSDHREEALEARRKFRHPSGDHITVLNVFRAFEEVSGQESTNGRTEWCRRHFLNERALSESRKIRDQLRSSCERLSIDWNISAARDTDQILRSLLSGSPQNTAQLFPDAGYKQFVGSGVVKIHPSSCMIEVKVPVIMYNELVFTTQVYARCVSSIPKRFVLETPLFANHRVASM